MTAAWDKLPAEALSIVLQNISNVWLVARCRLVCKAWNPVAERAMFGKTLRVKSMDKLIKITKHLAKKPSLGLFIHHIRFGDDYDDTFDGKYNMKDTQSIKKFLSLAFTPNIKTIQGRSLNKELAKHVMEIVRQSRKKFDKLETLLLPCSSIDDIHAKMTYQFRKSLKELELTLSEGDSPAKSLLDRLEEFGNLTKLTLDIKKKTSLKELEDILRKCNQLKEIHVEMTRNNALSLRRAEVETWLVAKNVEKNDGVHTIELASGVCPEVAEYLCYKYPNISRAVVHTPSLNTVKRMVQTIKAIDYVKAEQWEPRSREEVVAVASSMKNSRNIVSISNWMPLGNGIANVDFTKCTSNGGTITFNFSIWENKELLADICTAIGSIHSLDIHLMPLEDQEDEKQDNQTVSPFYLALNSSPSIEKLTFTDRWIKHQPFVLNSNTHLEHLKDVTIEGTILNEGVLPLLSKVAPQLKTLTLNSCTFDARSFQDRRIILSQSHLDTLCIKNGAFADYYEDVYQEDKEKPMRWIREQLDVTENEYLFLHVSESSHQQQDRYFVLQSTLPRIRNHYTTTCKQVPEDE